MLKVCQYDLWIENKKHQAPTEQEF